MALRPRQPRTADRDGGDSTDFGPYLTLVIVGLAILSGLLLRSLDLKADPPQDLSWSSAIYSDEAHNAYSARNWALYGRWQVDDYAPYVVYPWLNLFTGLVFRIAGIGFVQLKIVSLLAGMLLIVAMYFVGRSVSRRAGAIAAVITALSFQLIMYSRLGLAEMTQVLLVATAAALLARADRSRPAAILFGACSASAMLFVKVSAAFLPLAALFLLIYELARARIERRPAGPILRQSMLWLLGALVPFLVWLTFIFIPHRQTYIAYVFEHSVGAKAGHADSIITYLVNALSVGSLSKLYDHLPMVAAIGFLLLPVFFRRVGRTAIFSALVLGAGVAMLGYGYYHPDRYELFTLVPLIAGFAFGLDRLLAADVRVGHPWPGLRGALLYGLWLWPFVAQLAFRVSNRRDGTVGAAVVALLVGQAASFGLWGLHRLTKGGIPLRGRPLRFVLAAAMVVLALSRDAKLYTSWYGGRTRLMYEYSRELDQALPYNAVTGGFWAPAMLATSHKRAVFISDQWGANLDDPVERFGLTHLVVTGDEEFVLLDSITNGRESQSKIFRLYGINDLVLVGVVELPPQEGGNPDSGKSRPLPAR